MDGIIPVNQGHLKVYQSADPVAGLEASLVVPINARWRIISAALRLVTDATLQSRYVGLQFSETTGVYGKYLAPLSQTASQSVLYTFGSGVSTFGLAGVLTQIVAIPEDMIIPAGHTIETVTVNFQGGDDFGALLVLVEEWIEA